MEKLYDLKDKLCDNLDKSYEEIRRNPGRLSSGDLEYVRMLTDTIKNIGKIEMLEEEGGYSQEDGQDGGGYGRGVSYARGRGGYNRGGRNTRRDSRGRGMDGYSSRRNRRGRYSRDDGRSEMMEHLEMALDSASDQDRETIKRFMRQLENA